MLGRTPYVGKNRKEIKENMMNKQAFIKNEEIPFGWSIESADFINKLLIRKPESRLGSNKIKEHPWIKDYDWKGIFENKIEHRLCLEKKDNFDKKYCEEIETIGADTKLRYECFKMKILKNCLLILRIMEFMIINMLFIVRMMMRMKIKIIIIIIIRIRIRIRIKKY